MATHQCPRCELRFLTMAEVAAHLVDDHQVDPEAIEPQLGRLAPGIRPYRRAPDPTHARRSPPPPGPAARQV